jgi:TonB family protein
VGNGVLPPRVRLKVEPQYSADAMRAKIQGLVVVSAVVLPDGSVTDVKVIRSLDRSFGLDIKAIEAARQWRFFPGTRQGEPVPVLVNIELEFNLR